MRSRHALPIAMVTVAVSALAAPGAGAQTGGLPTVPSVTPRISVVAGARPAPGLFFLDPHQSVQKKPAGPEIVDRHGRVVWFHPLPRGESALDFRVQRYEGQPVLTWSQATSRATGTTRAEDVIMNRHYRIIRRIPVADGSIRPDLHEFQLTPEGDALITGARVVHHVDLASVGGPADGSVVDSIAREVDVRTGRTLFTWSALAHVPLADSYATPPGTPWDFFHINSVSQAPGGNLLISSRHCWALYDVDPRTGATVWTLGGRQSSFALGPGAEFAWQHDSRFVTPHEVRIFDNESGAPFFPARLSRSRALWLRLDYATRTATVARQIVQPPQQAETGAMGNVQSLPDGRTFVGWGTAGTFSEYGPSGRMLLRGAFPGTTLDAHGRESLHHWKLYRAFSQPWTGTPAAPPTVAVSAAGADRLTVSAAWNGATGVDRWRVLAGASRRHMTAIATRPWTGLVTTIHIAGGSRRHVRVEALDRSGRIIGRSAAVAPGG